MRARRSARRRWTRGPPRTRRSRGSALLGLAPSPRPWRLVAARGDRAWLVDTTGRSARAASAEASVALAEIDIGPADDGAPAWTRAARAGHDCSREGCDMTAVEGVVPTPEGGAIALVTVDRGLTFPGLDDAKGGELLVELGADGRVAWTAPLAVASRCTRSPVSPIRTSVAVTADTLTVSIYCTPERIGTCVYASAPGCKAKSDPDARIVQFDRPRAQP